MEFNGKFYTEDDYYCICSRVDYWGESSLTEEEQHVYHHFHDLDD